MNGGIKLLSDDLIRLLINAGLTKQQAMSVTAETITNLFMPDDGKILIAEANKQVAEMKQLIRDLNADYYELKRKMNAVSDNILAIAEAQQEHGEITDEKANNVIALYSALLSMNERKGADPTEAVRNASYVMYAYLGGQAKREINYQTDKNESSLY